MYSRGEPYEKENMTFYKFKLNVNSLLKKIPALHNITKKMLTKLFNPQNKIRFNKNSNFKIDQFDLNNIYWIDPMKIKYSSIKEFSKKHHGNIIDGDWDKLEKIFEKLYVFNAIKERYIDGKEWKDTEYYKQLSKIIEEGKFYWGCRNKSELDKRFDNLDKIYLEMKKHGYKTQKQLLSENPNDNSLTEMDEISVNIGRNGDLIFNDGAHRLSMIKILKVDKVPVRIAVVHPLFIQKYNDKKISFDELLN